MHNSQKLATRIAFSFLLVALVVSMSPGLVKAQNLGSKSISDEVVRLKGTEHFYYISKDAKRYAFPDIKTLASWYNDSSQFLVVPEEVLLQYVVGGNIPFRAGTKLIKEKEDPTNKIYAVEPGGVLRHIPDAEIFTNLGYKPRLVTEVEPYLMPFYTVGHDVEANVHPTGTLVKYGTGMGNIYYIDHGTKRFVTPDAFVANRFEHRFVLKISESIQYPDGEPITGYEEEISTPVLTEPVVEEYDLEVTTISATHLPDGTKEIKAVVTNKSSVALTQDFIVELSSAFSPLGSPVSTGHGEIFLETYDFIPGEQKEYILGVVGLEEGTYIFDIKVDYWDEIEEIDEENNYLRKVYSVGPTELSLSHQGPVAHTISTGSEENEMLNFTLTSNNDVIVEKIKIYVSSYHQGVLESPEALNYQYLKNIRLYELDEDMTLMGPLGYASAPGAGYDSTYGYYKEYTDSFTVEAGKKMYLSVQLDVDENYFTDHNTINVRVDLSGTGYIKEVDTGEYLPGSAIVPNTLTGNLMTVQAPNLTVAKLSTPSPVVVKGAQNVLGLGASLTAGLADDISVKNVKVRIYADDDGTFDNGGYGDTAANTIVETASLYEHTASGDAIIAGPKNITLVGTIGTPGGYYQAEFPNLNYLVTSGQQKNIYIKSNIKNTFSDTKYVAFDISPRYDIVAGSTFGILPYIGGPENLNLAANPNPLITAYQSGSLAVSVDPTTPEADVVVSGSGHVEFTKVRFTASREPMMVTGLALVNDYAVASGDFDDNIDIVTVSYPSDATGAISTSTLAFVDGVATLSNGQIGIYCAKDLNTILTVDAKLNTIERGADSGDMPKISLKKVGSQFGPSDELTNDFIAVGLSSGTKLYGYTNWITLDDSAVEAMVVRKTKVTAASQELPISQGLVRPQENVGIYKLTSIPEAGSNQNSTLKGLAISLNGSAFSYTSTPLTMYLYKSSTFSSSNLIGSVTAVTGSTPSQSVTFTFSGSDIFDNNEWNGDLLVYAVVDTTSMAFDPDTNETLATTLNTWTWSDGMSSSAVPVKGYPVSGGSGLLY